jgi:hypothetical protein
MKILTLKSGVDFEQTSNTDFQEVFKTDQLYFKPTPYPNEYGKIPNFISWNYEKYRIKKSFVIHKTIYLEMLKDLEFKLTTEDIFRVEANTKVIQLYFKSTNSSISIKSISFTVNDELINFYVDNMVLTQYINVREVFYTSDRELVITKQSDEQTMYFRISINLQKQLSQFSVFWINYYLTNQEITNESPDLKMIVDIDETTIPLFKQGEIYPQSKSVAWDVLNNRFQDEYYQYPERYYNANILRMYARYASWKSMYFRVNEHFENTGQVSVLSLDLEVAPIGEVVAELRKNKQNILNLGSIIGYNAEFANHYEFHPWFPGFSNYATYNFSGYQENIYNPTEYEFISYSQFTDYSSPSALVEATNVTSDITFDDVGGTIVYTATGDTSSNETDADSSDGAIVVNDTPDIIGDDNNTQTVDASISGDDFINDLVIENIRFPWDLLLAVFDYDEYTFNGSISYTEYNFKYAILDQMEIVNGQFRILREGFVIAGNYIDFSGLSAEYPIILYSLEEHYYKSVGDLRLTQEPGIGSTTHFTFDQIGELSASLNGFTWFGIEDKFVRKITDTDGQIEDWSLKDSFINISSIHVSTIELNYLTQLTFDNSLTTIIEQNDQSELSFSYSIITGFMLYSTLNLQLVATSEISDFVNQEFRFDHSVTLTEIDDDE